MFAKSLKGGGFGDAVQVTTKSCECCRIAVSGNNPNEVVIAFRNLTDRKVRDIAMSVSTDNGANFSEAEDISND